LQHLKEIFLVVVDRQGDDGHVGPLAFHLTGHFDARHVRQADVHQHERGMQLLDQAQCFTAIACLADNLNVLFIFQQHAQSGTHHRVIVN
jgi:hypothetical protein